MKSSLFLWCGPLGAALLVVLCQARDSRTDELIDLRLRRVQKACGQLCYTSAANLIGRRVETAPNASNVEQLAPVGGEAPASSRRGLHRVPEGGVRDSQGLQGGPCV